MKNKSKVGLTEQDAKYQNQDHSAIFTHDSRKENLAEVLSCPKGNKKQVQKKMQLQQSTAKQEIQHLPQQNQIQSRGFIRLAQFMNSTKLQLVCMIMIPELFLIAVSILLVQMNLSYTSDSVSKFSQNLYESSVNFVKIQGTAVHMSLEQQLQNEAVLLNAVHSLQFKAIRGEVLFKSGFKKPVLNIDRTYINQGDPYLLQQFKNNFTLFLSSWHQKNAIDEDSLDDFSSTQLNLSPRIDFILRSALQTNQADHSTKNKILIYQYFFAFGHDGMFILANGVNMTYSTFVDKPPCIGGTYKLDSRCRPYYLSTKNKDIITAFPPTVLQSGLNALPIASSGFCKRQALPLSLADDFIVNSLNNGVYSLVCNSINLVQIQLLFERFSSDSRVLIMLLDPISMNLVYSSGVKMEQSKITSFAEAYLKNLDYQNKEFFIQQIKQYATDKMDPFCYSLGQDIHDQPEAQSFNFTQNGEENVIILDQISSFDLSQIHTDDVYGENSPFTLDGGINLQSENCKHIYSIIEFSQKLNLKILDEETSKSKRRICVSPFWVFIAVIPKDRLTQQAQTLEHNMNKINIVFQCMTFLALGASVLIFTLYLRNLSFMMNAPVIRLTSILKEMNVCEAAVAAKHLNEEESENLFYSSDAKILFESFRNLFETLIFATQSMLGDKQCQTLLNLNKQITHFQQLNNYRAVGVCSNNIGNIHHNNSRYIEALEYYQMAIINAKYELKLYEEKLKINDEKELNFLASTKYTFKKFLKGFLKSKDFSKDLTDCQNNPLFNVMLNQSLKQIIPQYFIMFVKKESERELYEILFSRKFNYFKSLIGFMGAQNEKHQFSDWPAAKCFADELHEICRTKLRYSEKRKILMNHCELYIHYYSGDMDNSMRLLKENKMLLLVSPEFSQSPKNQVYNIFKDTPSSSKKTIIVKQDINGKDSGRKNNNRNRFSKIRRILNEPPSGVSEINNNNSNSNNNSLISGNQSIRTINRSFLWNTDLHAGIEGNSLKYEGQKVNSSDQQNLIAFDIPQKQDERSKDMSNYQLQSEVNYLLPPQNNIALPHKFSIDEKNQNNELDSQPGYIQQLDHPINGNDDEKIINSIFESFEFQQKYRKDSKRIFEEIGENYVYDNIVNRQHSQTAAFNKQREIPSNNRLLLHGQQEFENYQQNQQVFHSQVDVEQNKSNSGIDPTNQVVQWMTQGYIQDVNEYLSPKEQSISTNIFYYSPHQYQSSFFQGVVGLEEATILLLKKQMLASANAFTDYFERASHIYPFFQYQAVTMLSKIFQSAGLRDSQLELLAQNYELDTRFKISVVLLTSVQGQTEQDQKNGQSDGDDEKQGEITLSQQLEEYKQSVQYEYKDEKYENIVRQEQLRQKGKGQKDFLQKLSLKLCVDLMNKVMNKPDDMIGMIVVHNPKELEQIVEMLPFKFLSGNSSLFFKTIRHTFSKASKSKLTDKNIQKIKDIKDYEKCSSNNESTIQFNQQYQFSVDRSYLGQQKEKQYFSPLKSPISDIMNSVGTPQRKTSASPFSLAKKESSTCITPFLLLQPLEKPDLNNEIKEKDEISKYEGYQEQQQKRDHSWDYQESELNKYKQQNQKCSHLKLKKPENTPKQIQCKEDLCFHIAILEDLDDQEQKISLKNIEPKKNDPIPENVQLLTFRETALSVDHRLNQNSLSPKSKINKEKENQKQKAWISDQRLGFLLGVRKALQSILISQGEPNRIMLQVKLAETKSDKLIKELDYPKEKRTLNHFELHKKQDKQAIKRFAVVMTDEISFINPKDDIAFLVLCKEFMKYHAQLFILCLHEDQANQFQKDIPSEYAEVVIIFVSERYLIEQMISARSPNNFNYYPLAVEFF